VCCRVRLDVGPGVNKIIVGSREHGNKLFGSIKGKEFFDQLNSCQHLKKKTLTSEAVIVRVSYVIKCLCLLTGPLGGSQ
jgi:hypothetical protein